MKETETFRLRARIAATTSLHLNRAHSFPTLRMDLRIPASNHSPPIANKTGKPTGKDCEDVLAMVLSSSGWSYSPRREQL